MTQANRTDITITSGHIPEDSKLTGLSLLFDVSRILNVLSSKADGSMLRIVSCRITWVRYKPETNCLVAYELGCTDTETGESEVVRYFGKCYLAEDFENSVQKTQFIHVSVDSRLPTVIVLEDQRTILSHCLADRSLDALPLLSNSRKLVRLLHNEIPGLNRNVFRISDKKLKIRIVRFKPERRALVQIKTRLVHRSNGRREDLRLYVRHYADNLGASVYKTMKTLYQVSGGSSLYEIPEPLACLSEDRLLFMSELAGERLTDRLAHPPVGNLLKMTARALAALHSAPVPDLNIRTIDNLLDDTKATADSLVTLDPQLSTTVEKLLDWLQELPVLGGNDTAFVHGDFYHDQVLLGENKIGILDFDRSYTGDPLADVGNFCAHLLMEGLPGEVKEASSRAFLFAVEYFRSSGRQPDQRRLMLWTVFGLLQLAVSPFRGFEPDWKSKSRSILTLAEQIYYETGFIK